MIIKFHSRGVTRGPRVMFGLRKFGAFNIINQGIEKEETSKDKCQTAIKGGYDWSNLEKDYTRIIETFCLALCNIMEKTQNTCSIF